LKKIKVSIHGDEAFPVFFVRSTEYDWDGQLEIDRETYERWKKTFCEFENVQEEIVEAMKAAKYDCWSNFLPSLWDNDA